MRDGTRSRNYSPERDEFRRTHERHRAWGLARRHAEKLRRLHDRSADPRPAATSEEDRTPDPSPARAAPPTSRQAGGPTTRCPAPNSPMGDTPSAERKLPRLPRSPAMPRQVRQTAPDPPRSVSPGLPRNASPGQPAQTSPAESGKQRSVPAAAQTPAQASSDANTGPGRPGITGPGKHRPGSAQVPSTPPSRTSLSAATTFHRPPTKTLSRRQGQPWRARTPDPSRQQAAARRPRRRAPPRARAAPGGGTPPSRWETSRPGRGEVAAQPGGPRAARSVAGGRRRRGADLA